jgi:hypothetical protein
MKGIAI